MDSDGMLQGWNAIAEFLSCDVRTAKRWETERGLPVRRTRRTPGEGRANVYAVVAELEQWMAAARNANGNGLAAPAEDDVRAQPAGVFPAADDRTAAAGVFAGAEEKTGAAETRPAAVELRAAEETRSAR